jgi:hypothetical protein
MQTKFIEQKEEEKQQENQITTQYETQLQSLIAKCDNDSAHIEQLQSEN